MISSHTGSGAEDRIRPTTIIEAPKLARRLGIDLFLASETFQETGSFKFRAAYNVASRIPNDRVITASSGNFGQAMARACQLLGKGCIVVMPDTSARVKVDAVREFGARVDLIDVRSISRAARVADLAREDPDAYVASAYDDPLVIKGNASLGRELARLDRPFDVVVAPVGGGGLTSGIVTGLRTAAEEPRSPGAEETRPPAPREEQLGQAGLADSQAASRVREHDGGRGQHQSSSSAPLGVGGLRTPNAQRPTPRDSGPTPYTLRPTPAVIGAEPLMANDAARSLREGRIVVNEQEPQTIADGARTVSLGQHNWPILRDGLERIVEAPEDAIREAVRLLFSLANLKAEPTGALSVAALLAAPETFRGRTVCCVISGGNVDPAVYSGILRG